MYAARHHFSAYHIVSVLMVITWLLHPGVSDADEGAGRPWGRLNQPSLSTPESNSKSGYLGRYNPWTKGSKGGSGEPQRYRQRGDRNPASRAARINSGARGPGYPSTQYYAPQLPGYPGRNLMGNDPYSASPFSSSPYLGIIPGNGYLNPNYGNYWNDPYDSMMQPGSGIIWSDMWRR